MQNEIAAHVKAIGDLLQEVSMTYAQAEAIRTRLDEIAKLGVIYEQLEHDNQGLGNLLEEVLAHWPAEDFLSRGIDVPDPRGSRDQMVEQVEKVLEMTFFHENPRAYVREALARARSR